MKLTLFTPNLDKILQVAASVAEKKKTNPLITCVKLEATEGKLTISATDLSVSMIASIPATVEMSGSIAVDAKVLADIVHQLPDDEVTIELQKAQRVEIRSGSSVYKINGMSGIEYPALKGVDIEPSGTIDAALLCDMFEKTLYSVSQDETRYNITGLYLQPQDSGSIRVVGTDGHRLAFIERETETAIVGEPVLLPRKGAVELSRVLAGAFSVTEKGDSPSDSKANTSETPGQEMDDRGNSDRGNVTQIDTRLSSGKQKSVGGVRVGVHPEYFSVHTDQGILSVRLMEGKYPDYQQVLPKSHSSVVKLAASEFSSAVRRVALLSADKTRSVNIKLTGSELTLTSTSPECGEAKEVIPVDQEGADVSLAFSARYLLDMLGTFSEGETVVIKFDGDMAPAVFHSSTDENYISVLMPMRYA